MNKLSFRARHLDASKPMPIYSADEIPDLIDFAAINRAVPQMPTGMEKEEETEHHLQAVLSAQQASFGLAERLVIPVPDMTALSSSSAVKRSSPSAINATTSGGTATSCRQEKAVSVAGESSLSLDKDKPDSGSTRKVTNSDNHGDEAERPIRVQPRGYIQCHAAIGGLVDQDFPDYDMDSEDETWLDSQSEKLDLTAIQFEEMIDRLESSSSQTVVTERDAKSLLKQDDEIITAVYDYWLNKRLRTKEPLIPSVKLEKRDGSTTSNPYVAFRRRTEKMQTRKNRKNDESSYERMLKLRRDLKKAMSIMEMVKKREKSKKEMLQLTVEVLDKRYQMEDWSGAQLAHAESQRVASKQSMFPIMDHHYRQLSRQESEPAVPQKQRKREYRKRKHRQSQQPQHGAVLGMAGAHALYGSSLQDYDTGGMNGGLSQYLGHHGPSRVSHPLHGIAASVSSDDDPLSPGMSGAEDVDNETHPDGRFAFRRKPGVEYLKPLDDMGYATDGDESSATRVTDKWPGLTNPPSASLINTSTSSSSLVRRLPSRAFKAPGQNEERNARDIGDQQDIGYHLMSSGSQVRGQSRQLLGFGRRRMGRGGRIVIDRTVPYSNRDVWECASPPPPAEPIDEEAPRPASPRPAHEHTLESYIEAKNLRHYVPGGYADPRVIDPSEGEDMTCSDWEAMCERNRSWNPPPLHIASALLLNDDNVDISRRDFSSNSEDVIHVTEDLVHQKALSEALATHYAGMTTFWKTVAPLEDKRYPATKALLAQSTAPPSTGGSNSQQALDDSPISAKIVDCKRAEQAVTALSERVPSSVQRAGNNGGGAHRGGNNGGGSCRGGSRGGRGARRPSGGGVLRNGPNSELTTVTTQHTTAVGKYVLANHVAHGGHVTYSTNSISGINSSNNNLASATSCGTAVRNFPGLISVKGSPSLSYVGPGSLGPPPLLAPPSGVSAVVMPTPLVHTGNRASVGLLGRLASQVPANGGPDVGDTVIQGTVTVPNPSATSAASGSSDAAPSMGTRG